MQQMEVMVIEMDDIESINNLNSHVKTSIQYEAFKDTLAIVDLNSVEEGVVQLYVDLICALSSEVKHHMAVASRPKLSSDDSLSTDDIVIGAKSRARQKIDSIIYNDSESDFEE